MPEFWMDKAECRGADPALFIHDYGVKPRAQREMLNKVDRIFCSHCAVVKECLEYALEHPRECVGVWGGTDETLRRRLRRSSVETIISVRRAS